MDHITHIGLILLIIQVDSFILKSCLDLELDKNIYSLIVIQKAIYKFSDRISCEINKKDNKLYCLKFYLLDKVIWKVDDLKKSFLNELNDQSLRVKIKNETEAVRNVILAHAFSKTTLIEDNE